MSIITIDRSVPFNLGFKIGPRSQEQILLKDFIIEQDERSLSIESLDVNSIALINYELRGRRYISGNIGYERLKQTDNIRLDAKIFEEIWKNPSILPAGWKIDPKTKARYPQYDKFIYFDGTIFQMENIRFNLTMCFHQGEWRWLMNDMSKENGLLDVSAVLKS